jgi:thioredoxin 1
MSDNIIHLNDVIAFEETVINSADPVLVDFWAEWCGPCKALAPVLDEIANEYDGRITIAKVNVDENLQIPPKYGIRGIPTMLLFRDGSVQATKVGALSKANLNAFIDSNI